MNDKKIFKLLQCLWFHISQRRRLQFGGVFILMIITSFAEVISIGAVLPFLGALTNPKQIFDNQFAQYFIEIFGYTSPQQLLVPLTIFFSLAALFAGIMRLVLLLTQIRLGHAIGVDLSVDIYRRTLYQPFSVHLNRNSSEVISGISNKASLVVGSSILPVLALISSGFMMFVIMIVLISIEPVVALGTAAGFSVIYGTIIILTKKRLFFYSKCISEESNQVIKALQEGLGGIRDVLIDGLQTAYCKIYRNADLKLRNARANVQIIGASPRFGVETFGMILIAVIAYMLATSEGGISEAIPVLGALVLGAQRLLPMLQQAYDSWTKLRGGQAVLGDALMLLDQDIPEYVNELAPQSIAFNKSISLKNLSFRYDDSMPWIIREMNLIIPKGAKIGFIGETGSGKSTIMDIIMGLLYPSDGSLIIDDEIVTVKNHHAWHAHIAHVPQDIFLADATIAENIAFGIHPDKINIDSVKEAAQKAQIASTIETWSKKYSTMVGERGVRLSGGQRQRIGIARALYKKSDVIVFDEATSALDNDTEQAVMDSIKDLSSELTLLIVAHRLSTLKNCTQVIEMKDGMVKRSGTYQEIINKNK